MCMYSSPKAFWVCLSFILPSKWGFCGVLGRYESGRLVPCIVAKSKTGPYGETIHTPWSRFVQVCGIFLCTPLSCLSPFWIFWEVWAIFFSLSLSLFLAHASLAWHLLFFSYFCITHTSLLVDIWREIHDIGNGDFILVDGRTCFCVTLSISVSIYWVYVNLNRGCMKRISTSVTTIWQSSTRIQVAYD
jgi:hypothetical protein